MRVIKLAFYIISTILLIIFFISSQSDDKNIKECNTKNDSYITSDGLLFEKFDNISDWKTGTDVSNADSIFGIKEGNLSITLYGIGNTAPHMTKNIYMNFSNITNIVYWVYISNSSNIKYLTLYISSTKDFTNYFSSSSEVTDGWNQIVIGKSDFIRHENESWNNVMTRIRFKMNLYENGSSSASFKNLKYNIEGRAKVVITFDDGFQSVFDNARPIMEKNDQKGVVFIITDYPDNEKYSGYMNTSKITELYNSGWDISSHTRSHRDLTSLSEKEMENELNSSYNWLANHGFGTSAIFIAYPYGKYNDRVISYTKSLYKMGRTIVNGKNQGHISTNNDDMLYKTKSINIVNTTTVGNIENYINDTIEQKGLLVLTFHQIIEDANTPIRYNISDFEEISNFLKNRNSDIDIVTFSEYYNGKCTNRQ